MPQKPKRYVYVRTSKTVHDLKTLDERCNLDDVGRRDRIKVSLKEATALVQSYTGGYCMWCTS